MRKYRVNITEPAENDLRGIVRYISSQLQAPITALTMMRAIEEAIAVLETTPNIHPLVRDDRLKSIGYRSLRVKNYIVFYIVDEKEKVVDIDRILFSRRDWQNIL